MKYVTIPILCAHARKHRSSVVRALRAAGVKPERFPGVRGGRISEREAAKFLARHWPDCPPLS